MIKEKKMTQAGLEKIEVAKKEGIWQKAYSSKTKAALPKDLKLALEKHPKAFANFRNFATTYRNMYIGRVTNAKGEATRKKRIKEVVGNSLKNKKANYL